MKNAILSRLSSYSYTNGCNDALSDIPSQISSNCKIAHDNSLCIYGDFPNGHGQFGVPTVNTHPGPAASQVPTVRRKPKLTDKITALQKLVSPYGKVAIDKLPLIAALELVTKVVTIC
ncbi:hypothetical protein Pfo_029183 [Paulownia fortunei]|nr:hypothetical protein Pfo_029183 [Paulownia fortunei]